jgi:hypothetical protein
MVGGRFISLLVLSNWCADYGVFAAKLLLAAIVDVAV